MRSENNIYLLEPKQPYLFDLDPGDEELLETEFDWFHDPNEGEVLAPEWFPSPRRRKRVAELVEELT